MGITQIFPYGSYFVTRTVHRGETSLRLQGSSGALPSRAWGDFGFAWADDDHFGFWSASLPFAPFRSDIAPESCFGLPFGMDDLEIRSAVESDVPVIYRFIRELAEYEKLLHQVKADEAAFRRALFGERPYAEALIASWQGKPAAVAIFFHNFSTFLAKPGLYLEDIYVSPEFRGKGIGKALLHRLGALAVERDCGRFEWTVLDWNESAIQFYRSQGATVLPDWRVCRVTGEALERFRSA
ncbi:MAG TPA: GNAT family N-acetyltransferase [Candidatus Limnocylindria bacterium]|jgi:GNAT superfamily N-acetyltransferase|nr:GNAT family N-acetyltransferase [Candidatus Limnocylindria bacterium]